MVAKRYLLGAICVGVFGAVGFAQTQPPPLSAGTGMNPYLSPQGTGTGSAMQTLTAPPGSTGLPPGSVSSPWVGGTPAGSNGSGRVGANGPIVYELYFRTGPNFVIGGGQDLSAALRTGWIVGGGGRTLFMNQANDRAWVLDLGLSYNYTVGDNDRVTTVFTPQAKNAQTGNLNGPDELNTFTIRSLYRTTFNYAIGRDWFLNGPANVVADGGWNSRIGIDVGGRWGTSHANLIPTSNPTQYLRKSGVVQGIYVGLNWNWEMSLGATVLFTGLRLEVGQTSSNIIPPQDGNIQDLNVLWNIGLRF